MRGLGQAAQWSGTVAGSARGRSIGRRKGMTF